MPGRGRGGERAHTAHPLLRKVGDDLALAVAGQRQHRLAFGHHLAALEAQRGDHAGIGRHQRGVALAIARQVELAARLIQPGRGRVGARLLALVVGSAHRAVGQQPAQARLVGRGLLRVHGRRLHLVGGGTHGQLIVGRIQPRQHLAGLHDVAHLDQPLDHLAAGAETQVRLDAGTDDGGERARLRGCGLRHGGHEDRLDDGGGGGRFAAGGQQRAGGGHGRSDTAGKVLFTGASLRQEEVMAVPAWAGGEATAQCLVELHVGQHLLKAAVRQGEFAGQHRSLHVQQHQQVDLSFALQRLRALQRAAAVVDGAGQRGGALGLLRAHEQAVLDLLHGDQHRLLPGQQRLLGPRRLRADAGVDAAGVEDRRGKGQRDVREVHRREIQRVQPQVLAAEQGAQEELGPPLGARLGAAQRLGRDARLGGDQVGTAPQQFAGLAGADLARRRPCKAGVLVDDAGRRVAAQQHGQPRLRDAGQHAQRRHLRVERVGLGARAVQVEGAGLAFAQAAVHAGGGLALGRGQGLHDAQPLLGAAQHEVLPRHLAGHQQPRSFHTGRCGGGIGLRRVARRTHAAGQVDLPGHVDAGAQRARVGHALLDRLGQAAVAARGGRLHAHRGPQARALGIAARAGLGDALQRDGHVLVGGQGSSTSAVSVGSP